MEIYLLRHGIAEDTQPGRSDAERRLTPDGQRKTASVVRMARQAGLRAATVLSSPYVRALETAHIVIKELELEGEVLQTNALVPYGTPEAVWNELRDFRSEPAVLLAGHEPLLSQLAAYLLNAPTLVVEIKKSTLIRVDVGSIRPVPQGVLRWMITPGLAG